MKSTVAVKIGPISARFSGTVTLADIDAPNGYTISGEGQGGVAGFAKGGAKVRLEDEGPGTKLSYEVHAQVGGKIAQLGARLIDASAKQISDQFFDRFSAGFAAPAPAPAAAPVSTLAAPPPPRPMPSAVGMTDLVPREPFGLPMAFWIGGFVFLCILLLFIGSIF